MGDYDIDKTYDLTIPLTFANLAKELAIEDMQSHTNIKVKSVDINRKITRKGYGLIDRLHKYIGYDIKANAGDNPSMKFEMLQLLKLIYRSEETNSVQNDKYRKSLQDDFPIIKILSKPRLDNVNSIFSESTIYGKRFSDFLHLLQQKVDIGEKRYNAIHSIYTAFESIPYCLFNMVIPDDKVMPFTTAEFLLTEINSFMEAICDILNNFDSNQLAYKEGVLITFYNILCCHYHRCYDFDMVRLISEDDVDPIKDYYAESFMRLHLSKDSYNWDIISSIKSYLQNGSAEDTNAKPLIFFILYAEEIDDENRTLLLHAISKVKDLALLVGKRQGNDYSEGIGTALLVSLLQEIMNVEKHSINIETDTLRFSTGTKSLYNALGNLSEASPAVIAAWTTRIEDRWAYNLNRSQLMKLKRQIEMHVSEIRKFIFSHKNFSDMYAVHQVLLDVLTLFFKELNSCILSADIFSPIEILHVNEINLLEYLQFYIFDIYFRKQSH